MPKAKDGLKTCSKCHEDKSIDAFYRDRRAPDGLCCQCKTCMRAYQQSENGRATAIRYRAGETYRVRRIAYEASEKGKARRARHAATKKGRATQHRYYASEKCRIKVAEYIASEEFRASQARYRASPKGKLARRHSEARRRAHKIGAIGNHALAEFAALCESYGFQCLGCGRTLLLEQLTEDHIVPLSQGGSDDIGNIQPLCRSCNSHKGTKRIDYRPRFSQGVFLTL